MRAYRECYHDRTATLLPSPCPNFPSKKGSPPPIVKVKQAGYAHPHITDFKHPAQTVLRSAATPQLLWHELQAFHASRITMHDSPPFLPHSALETYFPTVPTVVAPPDDSKHGFTRHAARSHVIRNPRGRRFDFHWTWWGLPSCRECFFCILHGTWEI